MKGKILIKKINSLLTLSVFVFLGCGGGSSTSSTVESTTQISFKNKDLYSFNLNFVDSRQRYDLKKIDGINSKMTYEYFNFDSNDYELDNKEKQIFVNGKSKALADAGYALDKNGDLEATIDGQKILGEKSRRAGLCPNAVMNVDPVLKNVTLEDLIGGSASYYDSFVNLIKV